MGPSSSMAHVFTGEATGAHLEASLWERCSKGLLISPVSGIHVFKTFPLKASLGHSANIPQRISITILGNNDNSLHFLEVSPHIRLCASCFAIKFYQQDNVYAAVIRVLQIGKLRLGSQHFDIMG